MHHTLGNSKHLLFPAWNSYTRWSCGASSLCLGVGIEISHYDTDSDPYFTDNSRASDIIEIKLFNQESGKLTNNVLV